MSQPYALMTSPVPPGEQYIFRRADKATIPKDPANTDYAAFLAWVAAGNTPDPSP
jgi:hypothetical protein